MLQVGRLRRAFTALELLVAITIGLVVAGTMFAVFRAVAATANRVARMSQENQALRSGLLAVCEQNVDLWIDADNPQGDAGDPRPDYLKNVIRNTWNTNVWNQTDLSKPIDGNGGQGLRGFDVTRSSTGENWCTGSKQGMPFTPFEWLRDLHEFEDTSLDLFQPSPAALAGGEEETGWDRDYHWSAADERTWFQGDAAAHYPSGSASGPNAGTDQTSRRLQYGRYAIITNPYRTVNLVAGFTDTTFGTVSPRRAWRERMLLSLVNGLGYFGLSEYTPFNSIYATHGAQFTWSGDYTMYPRDPKDLPPNTPPDIRTIDWTSKMVPPLPHISTEAPSPCWFFVSQISGGGGTTLNGFPGWKGLPNEQFWGGQILNIGIYPASVYARDPLWGQGNAYSYLGNSVKNQGQAKTAWLVSLHRDNSRRQNHSGPYYLGPLGNYESADYEMVNLATAKRPLLVQRPADWPEVLVGTSRVLWGGQFMNTCLVRWSDPTTGRYQSITFNAYGTTLRGARQQRRMPTGFSDVGGWARWLEPWAMRRQRKLDTPTDDWAKLPNDRCLDDYADPAGTDPEFLP